MSTAPWQGIHVATALPFKTDLTIDLDAYAEHVQWLLAHGCHGVVPNGSLGEYQTLTVDERAAVVRTAVEASAGAGATELELVTPERTVSLDVGGIVASGYMTALAEAGVQISVLRRLRSIRRADGGSGALVVTLGVEGSDWTENRVVDAVVVEAGTQPVTDVYDELVPGSRNGGQIDLADLLARRPQTAVRNPDGTYQLFRIGDAVAGRNVHAAMLDAARLCREI